MNVEVFPFGMGITPGDVQDVWDAFVKPHQDSGEPQSVEMRVLMGILRATYRELGGKGSEDVEH